MRGATEQSRQPFIVGAYTIRPSLNEIDSSHGSTHVKPKSMSVLLCLAEASGDVCTRQQIFEQVWGQAQLSDEVLTQAIAELRRAFVNESGPSKIIQTVPRRGYRLIEKVRAQQSAIEPIQAPPINVTSLFPFPSLSQTSDLVGRNPQLTLLLDLAHQSTLNRSNMVLISGEPGIGKTRLAQEVLKISSSKGALTLSGSCSENQNTMPYLPFADIIDQCIRALPEMVLRKVLRDATSDLVRAFPGIRRVVSDLQPTLALPPEQQQRLLFNSFLAFLQELCHIQPLCLHLDDLQWGDKATLALLSYLASNLRNENILVVGAFRSTDVENSAELSALLDHLISHRLTQTISLKRLNRTDVNDILENLSGQTVPGPWCDSIYERTDGNPFFVEEVFFHLREEGKALTSKGKWVSEPSMEDTELPQSLRWILTHRLSQYSDGLQTTMQLAALMGRVFPIRPLQALSGLECGELSDVMDEAEGAQLVFPERPQDDTEVRERRYRFSHDLVRNTLVGQLSDHHRRELHTHIASQLERSYKDDLSEFVPDIVHHLLQAGVPNPVKFTNHCLFAANVALEKAAGADALTFADHGIAFASTVESQVRGELIFTRSQAFRSLSSWEKAIAGWQQAMAEFTAAGYAEGVAKCCKELGTMSVWMGDGTNTCTVTELGLSALGDAPRPEQVELLCMNSVGHVLCTNFGLAKGAVDRARSIVEELELLPALGPVNMTDGALASFCSRIPKAMDLFDTSIKQLRQFGDDWNLAPTLGSLQLLLAACGRWEDAKALNNELKDVISRTGHLGAQAWTDRTNSLTQVALTGDTEDLEEGETRAWMIAEESQLQPLLHGTALILGHTALLKADLDSAKRWCDHALDNEPAFWHGSSWAFGVKIGAVDGDQGPLKDFDQYMDLFPDQGDFLSWSGCKAVVDLTEGLALLGKLGKLQPYADTLRQEIASSGAVFVPGFPQLLEKTLALLAVAKGEWEQAEQHFCKALEQTEYLPHVLEYAEVLRWYAWMLAQRGDLKDKKKSQELIRSARRRYLEIGLEGLADDVIRLAS